MHGKSLQYSVRVEILENRNNVIIDMFRAIPIFFFLIENIHKFLIVIYISV